MLKLQVIVGSTRPGRAADGVVRWLTPLVRAHAAFESELLDLRDWPLPFFQENMATIGDFKNPTYSDPIVKRWNEKIKEADAYLIVTPEYNHGIPGVLKNAIDTVFLSFGFRQKPVAFVGYSAGIAAGVRSVEQLNQVFLECEAVPVRTQTLIPMVMNAFDAEGKPVNAALGLGLTIMLDDLAWLAKALKNARVEGQLPPPTFRMRAAANASKKP
jgi:NAD(P)H-dependent FMN reductase